MTVLHHPDIDLPRLGLILHFMQIYQATLENAVLLEIIIQTMYYLSARYGERKGIDKVNRFKC